MDMMEAIKYIAREEGIEEGFEKGRLETKEAVIINGIVELGLSDEQAAKVAGVEISFVQQIRQNIEKKQ